MFAKAPTGTPRHMAGSKRTHRPDSPAPVAVHLAVDGDDSVEVTPAARVHRSRLAFAVSATLAALPLIALDNFPATADTGQVAHVETTADEESADRPLPTVTTAAPSSTTAPPPETTQASPSTEASTTSAAPDTTESTETVAALAAPPPQEPPTTQAPPTTAAPAPEPAPEGSGTYGDPNDPATWDRLAQCESNGNWSLDTGNGYYGGLQFSLASWRDVGGSGYPHEHSREEQIHRGKLLQARYGWGQWPTCSRQLGYR